jgi:hypothetical protein
MKVTIGGRCMKVWYVMCPTCGHTKEQRYNIPLSSECKGCEEE